jgi:hypothetical protein
MKRLLLALALFVAPVAFGQKISQLPALGGAPAAGDKIEVSQTAGPTSKAATIANLFTAPAISSPTFSGTIAGTFTIGGTPTFPSSVTLDSEWDSIAKIEAAIGGSNIILATEIDTSAELAAILGDETGTGAIVFGSSPTIAAPTFSGTIAGTYTLGGTPTFPASVTLDSEWDTIAEIEAATGGVNIILATEIDTSSELAGILTDETGTGAAVFANTPTLISPVLGTATGTSVSVTGALYAYNGTAIPAGGTTASGIKISSTANFGIFFGSGSPTLSAAQGSLYLRSDGVPFYNTNGTTGWTSIGAGTGDALVANPLSQFASTTSLQLAGVLSDETGSGAFVLGTSPAFTTSITTGSTSFSLFNSTATTVNAFGAATTLNIGASAATVLNLGGASSAAELRLLEPSGSGTNYTAFKVGAQSANITYTLPATVGSAGTFLKDAAGDGVLSWATPSGSGDVTAASTFGTDNRLIRSDGTSKGVQSSGITIDDSNIMSGVAGMTGTGTWDLSAATVTLPPISTTLDGGTVFSVTDTDTDASSDTVLVKLAHNSGADPQVIYLRMTGDLDGTPTNDYDFTQSGATFLLPLSIGTSNALTTGTIELGATSDTTISRTGAGAIAVEGVGVSMNSTSATHTAGTYEVGAASDTTISRTAAGAIAVEGNAVFTAATKSDVLQAATFAADAGANDTYAATLSPAITAYVTGAHYRFKANTANTGTASVNFNSLGAKTIVKAAGGITTTLADNDIRAGQWCDLVYDGTNMQLQSTLGNSPAGSGTVTSVGWTGGIVSIATATSTPAFTVAGTSGGVPYFDSTTSWATSALLTANAMMLGGGAGAAPKTAAGFTTDGTSILTLGVAGTSVGTVAFKNATSGTASLLPPTGALGTYSVTLPNAASTLPIFGQQITFSGPSAARTVTFPDANFAAARTDAANSFTGTNTFGSATSVLLGTAGSAVGDIGFRNATSGTATLAPPTGALGTYTITLPNAAGTLTESSSTVTNNSVVLGAGNNAIKIVSTITTDGASILNLGASGTPPGKVVFANATSGTITLTPPTGALGSAVVTLPAATTTLSGTDTADTFTNKTYDAAATGNTLKLKGYLYLTHPHLADGTGATIGTTATAIGYGHATFSNSAAKTANYVEYYLQVPEDLDTAVDLRLRLKQLLGNTDTGKQSYELTSVSVADSAVPTAATLANAVAVNFSGDASGANGDVETSAWTTATGWKGALTAGQTWRIRLARVGDDGTNDTSTVNSTELGLVVEYGVTQ